MRGRRRQMPNVVAVTRVNSFASDGTQDGRRGAPSVVQKRDQLGNATGGARVRREFGGGGHSLSPRKLVELRDLVPRASSCFGYFYPDDQLGPKTFVVLIFNR